MISKSAKKRRFKDEEKAAAEVAGLSDRDLEQLGLDGAVTKEAVRCRTLKGGSRQRQIKYLAKLLRQEGMDDILEYLAARKGSKLKENALHREAERLRDDIINEAIASHQEYLQAGEIWEPDWSSAVIADFALENPVDEEELRKSVYQYVKSRAPNHYRETFRLLRTALEKKALMASVEAVIDGEH